MALLDNEILSQKNKDDLQKVRDILAEYGLVWNWGSIYYVIYEKNKDWDSLRVYNGRLINTVIILMAGMKKEDRSEDRAFEIMQRVSDEGIHPVRFHRFLDQILEEKHFFMGIQEQEAMENLIQADNQEVIALQNLIYSVISKQLSISTYQDILSDLKKQESNSTKQ